MSNTVTLGSWELTTTKSHILKSHCFCSMDKENSSVATQCNYCTYQAELTLPDLPEMTFDSNTLSLKHVTGVRLEINCLDALKKVNATEDLLKVAFSEEWMAKRGDNKEIKNVVKPFDWTFTTSYDGTLHDSEEAKWGCEATTQMMDMDKLRARDKILYHDEMVLFEDELADNGSTKLDVRVRVMPGFVLVLLKFYLRVDKVLVRTQESRLYCENDWDYVLRDVIVREAPYGDITVPACVIFDEQKISQFLPVKSHVVQRLSVERS